MISSYKQVFLFHLSEDTFEKIDTISKLLKENEAVILFSDINHLQTKLNYIKPYLSNIIILNKNDLNFISKHRKDINYIEYIEELNKHSIYYEFLIDRMIKYVIIAGAIYPKLDQMSNIDVIKAINETDWHSKYDGRLGYAVDFNPIQEKTIIHHKYSSTIGKKLFKIDKNGIKAIE